MEDIVVSEREFPHWFTGSDAKHQVARAIAQYGPIARTPLSQILGLSQGALSRITSDLMYEGVIEEMAPNTVMTPRTLDMLPTLVSSHNTDDHRGRPQTALRIRAEQRTFVGVNIHTEAITVLTTDALCQPLTRAQTEPLQVTDPETIVAQITRMVTQARADCVAQGNPEPVAIGLSFGGHAVDDHIVNYAPFLHWDGEVDLGDMVTRATGLPTAVFNDLDSLLLHESWFGAAVGVSRFAILTMGSGVGYSLSEEGQAVNYPDKSYGLAGHVLIDPQGPRCSSGHIGCSQCLTNDSIAEEYSAIVGRVVTFDDFARDLHNHSPQARRLAERTCFRLGILIAMVANLAMPSQVIISGESSWIAKTSVELIRKGIDSFRHSQMAPVKFAILDFAWSDWAAAAASRAIAQYIG